MSLLSPTRLRIQKEAIVRLTRSLKGTGLITVSPGQEVSPSDVVGTASVSGGFRVVSLADLLGVGPSDVEKYLRRAVGQRIYKGELLAYKSSFLKGKKIIVSPTDGVLDFLNPKTGELRLRFLPKKQDLPAGVYGIVEVIDRQKGQVVIRTQASLVFGMFGSGRVRDGTLHVVTKRDEFLEKKLILPTLGEQILVGGSLIFKDAITAAISAGVNGMITGGINAKDYRGMSGGKLIFPKKSENDIGISIVVCEGFGSIPIGEDIYEILSSFDDKFVSIDGDRGIIYLPSFQSQSMTKVRTTKLPPLKESETIRYVGGENNLEEITVGLRVRIIGNSYPGNQGRIISLDQAETLIPSGVRAFMATVETKRYRLKIPVANLEIIL